MLDRAMGGRQREPVGDLRWSGAVRVRAYHDTKHESSTRRAGRASLMDTGVVRVACRRRRSMTRWCRLSRRLRLDESGPVFGEDRRETVFVGLTKFFDHGQRGGRCVEGEVSSRVRARVAEGVDDATGYTDGGAG